MANDKSQSDNRIDDAFLARYLRGACDPADAGRVERWLAADPARQEELAALRAAWNPAPVGEADPDDRMWRAIAAQMDEPAPRPALVRGSGTVRWWTRRTGIAAAAAIVAIVGTMTVQRLVRPERAGPVAPNVSAMSELATSRGERATGHLPDGSRVILAPESRLRIAPSFATTAPGPRDVYLEGEAFFTVTHDSTRPFRVHTSNGIAEDLGTEFVVSAYPEARATRVVVASGLVSLAASNPTTPPMHLSPGDLGHIDAAGTVSLRHGVDVAALTGWTQGNLAFDQVPLRDALTQLSRWYDVDIRVADSALARRGFTATFHDEQIAGVLRTLEVALDVRAEQRGRIVTLRPLAKPAEENR